MIENANIYQEHLAKLYTPDDSVFCNAIDQELALSYIFLRNINQQYQTLGQILVAVFPTSMYDTIS